MKRNPIIKRYVTKIRRRLKYRRWKEKHSNKIKEHKRRYREKNKKKISISSWLSRGLITDNIDEVYKRYEETTNCDLCNIFLEGNGRSMKCMDHSHKTGLFRNILCNICNIRRGEDNF